MSRLPRRASSIIPATLQFPTTISTVVAVNDDVRQPAVLKQFSTVIPPSLPPVWYNTYLAAIFRLILKAKIKTRGRPAGGVCSAAAANSFSLGSGTKLLYRLGSVVSVEGVRVSGRNKGFFYIHEYDDDDDDDDDSNTPCSKKVSCLMFDNNFGKCGPIFNFSHQVIRKKILYIRITKISTSPVIYCYTTLWKSKIQKCYWLWQHLNRHVLEDTLRTWFRQTVSGLLTLTDWLTFWSLSDDVSNQQLNLIQLNIVAS